MSNEKDCWTVDAMERWGGSFVKALGELARHADRKNLALIKLTWPDYWEKYERMGQTMKTV